MMKLTKTKLGQLIREAVTESWLNEVGPPPDTSTPSGQADYEDWERRARGHAAFVAMGEDDDESELQLPLDWNEYDLVSAALLYAADHHPYPEKELHSPPWAKAVYTVIDDQWGESEGAVDTDNTFVEISKPSLRTLAWALNIRQLPAWLENSGYDIDDESIAELPALKEKVQALLAGEEKQPEPEPEPEVPEDERIDPRFANLDYRAEALRRQKGQSIMKITKEQIRKITREELQSVLKESRQAGFLGPGFSNPLSMQEGPHEDSTNWLRSHAMPMVREIGDALRKELGDEVVGRIRTKEMAREDPVHWHMAVGLSLTGGLPTMLEIKVFKQYATVKIGGDEVETIEYPGLESQGGLADVITQHVKGRLWHDAEAGHETLADRKFADRPE